MEYNVQDFEIFRTMYYNNTIQINDAKYKLAHCTYLDVVLTDYCNAACKFCVAKLIHDKLDCNLDKHLQSIKYAVDNLNVREVLLLGGEPTLSKHLIDVISFCKELKLDKICMTTNGIKLKNAEFRDTLFSSGITHINLSVMSLDPDKQYALNDRKDNITLSDLELIFRAAQSNNVKIRINNNIFKNNNDSATEMRLFYEDVKNYCNSVKFSSLLQTDAFSTVTEVTKFNKEHILTNDEYTNLFTAFENLYYNNTIIRNKETLGFVENSIILLDTPIILNYNHSGKLMKLAIEDKKIHSIKLLPNSHLSISWNREAEQYYIK